MSLTTKKTLVACFSASGVTAGVARKLAEATDADHYEIRPKTPYSAADLNWNDKQSRSSVEMRDKTSRPELADRDAKLEQYEVIFLGFPIWWYVAPTIVNTFLEAYDCSGKTIILFATSGGSGFGKAAAGLADSAKGAVLREGRVFQGSVSKEDLAQWAQGLRL